MYPRSYILCTTPRTGSTLLWDLMDFSEAWENWFSSSNNHPYRVLYEDLESNYVNVTHAILEHLNLELPTSQKLDSNTLKMADQLSEEWEERYLFNKQEMMDGSSIKKN